MGGSRVEKEKRANEKWNMIKRGFQYSISLGLGFSYFLSIIRVNSDWNEITEKMNVFYNFLPLGMFIALILTFILIFFKRGEHLLNVGIFSIFFLYAGFLKALAWNFVLWIVFVITFLIGSILYFRKFHVTEPGNMIFFHVIGYLSGLYLFLHLKAYLIGWDFTLISLTMVFHWIFL